NPRQRRCRGKSSPRAPSTKSNGQLGKNGNFQKERDDDRDRSIASKSRISHDRKALLGGSTAQAIAEIRQAVLVERTRRKDRGDNGEDCRWPAGEAGRTAGDKRSCADKPDSEARHRRSGGEPLHRGRIKRSDLTPQDRHGKPRPKSQSSKR